MVETCSMKRLIFALIAASFPAHAAIKTIALVHGAFADGSGWKPVADVLQGHGYSVRVVQQPETSFEADVAATRRLLDKAGPCVLVGHSYGGMIITEVGMHPDVKALVYVAAFHPDVGARCRGERRYASRKNASSEQERRTGRRRFSSNQLRRVSE
jgi:pimeloyl-ACP methyl ester carboxylesterase